MKYIDAGKPTWSPRAGKSNMVGAWIDVSGQKPATIHQLTFMVRFGAISKLRFCGCTGMTSMLEDGFVTHHRQHCPMFTFRYCPHPTCAIIHLGISRL